MLLSKKLFYLVVCKLKHIMELAICARTTYLGPATAIEESLLDQSVGFSRPPTVLRKRQQPFQGIHMSLFPSGTRLFLYMQNDWESYPPCHAREERIGSINNAGLQLALNC